VIRRWKVKSALIVPSEYLVHLELQDGRAVDIQEDETGVYVYENNLQIILAESPITLPTFSDKKFFCIKNIAS
jgi:antitoxin component of MazEF toxin-antitoxin module